MKCRQALEVLYDYLDNQLEQPKVEELKAHLADCGHCFDKFQFEEKLNSFIKAKSSEDISHVIDGLKFRVKQRLEQLSPAEGDKEPPPRFFLFRPAIAAGFLAVAAIICCAFYFIYSNRNLQAEALSPFIENHQKAIANQIEMDICSQDFRALDSCLSTKMNLPRQVFMADDRCYPSMGKVHKRENSQHAHIVYNMDNRQVSVFVLPVDGCKLPEQLNKSADDTGTYSYDIGDHVVTIWKFQDFWCVAIGAVESPTMIHFVSDLRAPARD